MHNYLIISTLLFFSFFFCQGEPATSITNCSKTKCDTELLTAGIERASLSQESSEYFTNIFSTSQWPARWNCGEWTSFNGWLYILSDLGIWLAYFMIPMVLVYFLIKKRETLPFKRIFALFIAFILACGLTHLMDAVIFWWPAYNLSALIRFFTAVVSLGTVFGLVKVIPAAMNMRSPDELLKEISERKIVEQQLSQKVKELEELNEKMIRREKKLKELQSELEAFSYSVSHDLRSPLRTINGFCNALQEDYADKLPEKAQDYLDRVSSASVRMDQLIEDMLNLSHISRREMENQEFDFTSLAQEVVKSFPDENDIKYIIEENMNAYGDRGLIKIALENLIGNSVKYADKNKDQSVIEIGTELRDGNTIYYVKDNGVGFDMKYADKLFKAFQRLHSSKEFKGTGIGLATVKRIIMRHNGEIWADSKIDEGTSMYFSLHIH